MQQLIILKPLLFKKRINRSAYRCVFALLCFFLFANHLSATHIVGGSLTYQKVADSTYEVTLKLYRDCGPGNANFPNPAVIYFEGPYGHDFTPSYTLTIPRPPATELEPIIDTCVIDPGICVEEAIYIDTVYNVDPQYGYHLYFTLCCRNASLQNVVNPLSAGESFYTYLPPDTTFGPDPEQYAIWHEDFDLADGTTVDAGVTAWSVTTAPGTDYAEVQSKYFEAADTDGDVYWTSDTIDISSQSGVHLYANLFHSENLENTDSIRVYYNLDGSGYQEFEHFGSLGGNFANGIEVSSDLLSGNYVIIRIKMINYSDDEYFRIDDVIVAPPPPDTLYTENNSPQWTNFPPIFVCANEVLNFDHSAVDPDGDSLVYFLYDPFEGRNTSSGDFENYLPTFPDDSAVFQDVNWEAGFNSTNPLGGGNTVLDSSTGMLTINPPNQGQYVVGVMVQEWRDGKLIGYVVRDFQFNVVVCPPVAPASIIDSVLCNDSTIYFRTEYSASSYRWDFGDPTATNDTTYGQQVSYTYPDTGTYYIELIVNYQTPCADTAYDTVEVQWLIPEFTHDAPKCIGEVASFTNNTTFSNNVSLSGYSWDFGDGSSSTSTSPNHTYTSDGTFSVTLVAEDADFCVDSVTYNVDINPAPIVDAGIGTTTCANDVNIPVNGSVTNATGGVWSTYNGKGNFDNNTDLATNYNFTAADTAASFIDLVLTSTGNGICQAISDTVHMTFTPAPVAVDAGDTSICFGQTGVLLTAIADGGTPPYTYNWSNGDATSTSFVNGPGTYYVSVSDANGCPASVDTFEVDEFTSAIEAIAGSDISVCTSDLPLNLNGSVVAASGGTWVGGVGGFTPDRDSLQVVYSPNVAEVAAGGLTLELVTTGNGTCLADTDEVNITITDLQVSTDTILPSCGGFDGSVIVTPLNGSSPYSYQWDASTGSQTTDTATGLGVGTYLVTVTDAIGCEKDTFVLLDNNQPFVQINDSSNVICYGEVTGEATVVASGGTPGYTYQWDTLAGSQTTATATGLGAGIYYVTVEDAINCINIESVIIEQPDDSIMGSITAQTNLLCAADSNGTATVSASGGNGGFTYSWGTSPVQTGPTANNLPAGDYWVYITDDSLCVDSTLITITEPDTLQPQINILSDYSGYDVSCPNASDGIAEANQTGGTSPFTYIWDDPLSQSAQTANSLPSGLLEVTITDANGCTATDTIVLNQPDSILVIPSILSDYNGENISCFGASDGSIGTTVSGGAGGYSYAWSNAVSTPINIGLNAGTYTVTITDGNGCTADTSITLSQPQPVSSFITSNAANCSGNSDGSIVVFSFGGNSPYTVQWDAAALFQVGDTATDLEAGIYGYTITDQNGCTADSTAEVTEPDEVSLLVSDDDTICPGDIHPISSVATGGNGGFTYIWDQGLPTGQFHQVTPSVGTEYTVFAIDAKGCKSPTDSIYVSVRLLDPDSSYTITSPVCEGEPATVEAGYNGNLGPYTYTWSGGVPSGAGPHTVNITSTTDYYVFITDVCSNLITDTVTVEIYPLPETNIGGNDFAGCVPLTISVADTSGNTGATYLWDFGDGNSSSDSSATHTYEFDGTYLVSLEIISNEGCSVQVDTLFLSVVDPLPIVTCSASPEVTDTRNMEIQFESSLHSSYLWHFGDSNSTVSSEQNPSFTYSDSGTYNVTLVVENTLGCMDTCETTVRIDPAVEIKVPTAFTPSTSGPNPGPHNQFDNSVFFPFIDHINEFHMMIFNRWGEMVFESIDKSIGWDGYYRGEICQQDVYVYKIKATYWDGTPLEKVGDVMLLR